VLGEKRKAVSDGRDDDEEPQAKKVREELQLHPMYEENPSKILLESCDGKRFSVDKTTLSTYR